MKRWCKPKGIYCSMATTNGYCQVTACIHMAEPMPICNDENAVMPYETPKVNWNVDGMIPIEWIEQFMNRFRLDKVTSDEYALLHFMLTDWEKENETNRCR